MSTSHPATARSIALLTQSDVRRILYNMKTTRIPVAAARRDFAKILARAAERGSRIKVTRYGTTLAGIISRADLSRLKECDETTQPRRAANRRKRSSARTHK